MAIKRHNSKNITVLFSCIGRRVSLLNSFKKAIRDLGLKGCVIGADASLLSPALQLCDRRFVTQRVSHPGYLEELLDIARKNKVDLLVPTVDLDLKLLAANRQRFERFGCRVLISSPEVIGICQDKRKTYRFLVKNGFDGPRTVSLSTALRQKRLCFPLFLKPWDGSASRGNAIVHNRRELAVIGRRIPNCIVQEFVKGREYTCDVFVDFDMQVRCVVPRRRIEVRSGEVSKGVVVKDPQIMKLAGEVVSRLGAGPGVITIQLIADGRTAFIEINPRFGGGVPLSIRAGADFPKWILQLLIGKETRIKPDGFKDGLVMLRYDSEVWLEGIPEAQPGDKVNRKVKR